MTNDVHEQLFHSNDFQSSIVKVIVFSERVIFARNIVLLIKLLKIIGISFRFIIVVRGGQVKSHTVIFHKSSGIII